MSSSAPKLDLRSDWCLPHRAASVSASVYLTELQVFAQMQKEGVDLNQQTHTNKRNAPRGQGHVPQQTNHLTRYILAHDKHVRRGSFTKYNMRGPVYIRSCPEDNSDVTLNVHTFEASYFLSIIGLS